MKLLKRIFSKKHQSGWFKLTVGDYLKIKDLLTESNLRECKDGSFNARVQLLTPLVPYLPSLSIERAADFLYNYRFLWTDDIPVVDIKKPILIDGSNYRVTLNIKEFTVDQYRIFYSTVNSDLGVDLPSAIATVLVKDGSTFPDGCPTRDQVLQVPFVFASSVIYYYTKSWRRSIQNSRLFTYLCLRFLLPYRTHATIRRLKKVMKKNPQLKVKFNQEFMRILKERQLQRKEKPTGESLGLSLN